MHVWTDEGATLVVTLDPPAALNSVVWTLRDGAGAVVNGLSAQAAPNLAGATSVLVTLPGSANAKAPTTAVAYRYLETRWAGLDGLIGRAVSHYRVVDWMPLTASATDARALTGLNRAELPDDDVDILTAALSLRSEIGSTFPGPSPQDQRLIALRAVLDLRASLMLRVAASMSSDSIAFERFSALKLEDVFARIQGEYDRLLAVSAPTLVTPATPVIFSTVGPTTDPFTGT
jgi:hypothetical protein